jgi:hypothetical protein
MGRHREAQAEYEGALKHSVNRFNSLYGAGRAAELAGNKSKAALYYKKLVEVTANGTGRERMQHVRAFLSEE